MLFCILGRYVYLPACLIFSNVFLLCLIVFCCQITHICISWFYAGSCRCHFFDLSDFLCTHVRLCCLHRPLITFTLLLVSCFALFRLFLMFILPRFVLTVFAMKITSFSKFVLARFRSAWCFRPIFLALLEHNHLCFTVHIFFSLQSST